MTRGMWRGVVPWLGGLALLALFFKLPETPNVFGIFGCPDCGQASPYLPLFGAAYFALLMALALVFPSFPGPFVARGGLVWAVLLALLFTWVGLPGWCVACLLAHACNIAIWSLWVIVPATAPRPTHHVGALRALVLLAPVCVVALFCSLNLTFMVYSLRSPVATLRSGPQPGDDVAAFVLTTTDGQTIDLSTPRPDRPLALNFVSSSCSYCKEQLPLVEAAARQLPAGSLQVVNVAPELTEELTALAPSTAWAQDAGDKLRTQLRVAGTPTLVVLNATGTVASVFQGLPTDLTEDLVAQLSLVTPPAPAAAEPVSR